MKQKLNSFVPIVGFVFFLILFFAPITSFASAPVAGLIGYWSLNEGGGTVAGDSSGSGNTATLINTPTWTTGKVGSGALSFNGTSQYVSTNPVNFGGPSVTFSAWVKGSGSVMSQASNGANTATWTLNIDSSTGKIYFYANGWSFSNGGLTPNVWNHVVVVVDTSTTKYYINGVLDTTLNTPLFDTGANQLPNNYFNIGFFSNNGTYFTGSIDEVRVYNRALSPQEVSDVYTDGGGVTPPGDTTPPSLSSITSTNITSTSATITWNTDEASDSQVEYGLTTGYGSSSGINSTLTTSHTTSLSSLTASTVYHYRVKSKDASGNLSTGGDNTFTTTANQQQDTTAPSVPTALSATAISSSQVNLSWTASTDAVGVTGYKIFRAGTQIATSPTNSYLDSGLTASTNYSYTVSAYDEANNSSSQSTSANAITQAGAVVGSSGLWSGVIAPSRAIDWSVAGLPANYPDGETTANPWTPPVRSTICATIAPEGSPSNYVAPTDIYSAEMSCPPGGVVVLQPGRFYLTSLPVASSNYPNTVTGITLRGSGADKTFVYISGSGGAYLGTADGPQVTVTGGLSQGSTQLTLSYAVGANTLLSIYQCASGFSGTPCSNATDSQVDNGGLWTCMGDGPWCSHGTTFSSSNEGENGQTQIVRVTASSGNTVTISPGLYLPNWSTSNTVAATVFSPTIYGLGLEGITLDQTQSTGNSSFNFCLGCWIKGVRFVNAKLDVGGSEHYLISNNYLANYGGYKDGYGITLGRYGFGDGLILNNIVGYGVALSANGPGEGAVFGYNYLFDNGHIFFHTGGTALSLMEGNSAAAFEDDNIHGVHDLDTLFRNRITTQLGVYNVGAYYSIQLGQGTRFSNVIGNVLGTASYSGSYEYSPANLGSVGSPIYSLGIGAVLNTQGVPYDSLAVTTLMRWGNVTAYAGSVHGPSWLASEVPSSLNAAVGYQQQIGTGNGSQTTFSGTLAHLPAIAPNGMVYDRVDGLYAYDNGSGVLINNVSGGSINYTTGAVTVTFTTAPSRGSPVYVNYLQQTTTASPYQNPLPSSHALPLSFIFPNLVAGTSGTNLPFGKVCTAYTTLSGCGGSYYHFPEPGIGPDVTGGNGPGGYSYELPASMAWANLPVDPSYQNSYPITSSSWSGGVETLTVSGLSSALIGEFDISGTTGCSGTKLQITASTPSTVSYALASNPGSCSGATFKFPNVRVFNDAIYTADINGGGGGDVIAPSTPTNLSATAVSSSGINLSWTASTDNTGVSGYKIFRNGTQIATSATNSYSNTGLSASTLYSYTVSAYDAAGNTSSQSSSASATTQSAVVPSLAGDLNLDHIVNSLDFSLMNSVWLTSNTTADLDHNGIVNSLDFSVLSSQWGQTW